MQNKAPATQEVISQPATRSQLVQAVGWILLLVTVGLLASAAVWLFTQAHTAVTSLVFGPVAALLAPLGSWTTALLLAIGGLITALVIGWMMRGKPLPGLGHVIYSEARSEGRLPWYRGLAYVIGATLSIGFKIPVGSDTPAAMTGAYLTSWIGQRVGLSGDLLRALVVAGVAAGLGYNLGAHLAGALFALEIVTGGFGSWRLVGAAMIGAAAASLVSLLTGAGNPTYAAAGSVQAGGGGALVAYLMAAIIAALFGTLFVRLMATARMTLARLPLIARAILVGLIIGVVGLAVPDVLGTGVSTMQAIFSGQSLALVALLGIFFGKLILVPLAAHNGFNGGIIGPSLAMGAALGAALAQIALALFPNLSVTPLALEIVCAAAMVAATTHGALFAAVLMVELAGSIAFIGPILIAAAAGYLISQRLHGTSAYTAPFTGWGLRLSRAGYAIDGELTKAAHGAGIVPDEVALR